MKQNIFEMASRLKTRFTTVRGNLTVEQLWDLPLTGEVSLDSIAIGIDKELRETTPRSFVKSSTNVDKALQLKLDIVVHIIEVRSEEATKKAEAKAKADQRKLIKDQLAVLENEALLSGSKEDLLKRLSDLED